MIAEKQEFENDSRKWYEIDEILGFIIYFNE